MKREQRSRRRLWILGLALLGIAGAVTLAWRYTPLEEYLHPETLDGWLGPYRTHWLGGPLTVLVYVVAGFLFFPVLLLVLFTGMIFGPWLGALYALAGSLASAAASYGLGCLIGPKRLERWGGSRVKRLDERLSKKGVMVVFLARKFPAPYTLVNLVAGASRIRFLDYMLGTLLGMGSGVVVLAVFGDRMTSWWKNPTWTGAGLALALFFIPVAVAFLVQKLLKRHHPAAA
jgi:uncharacterized membrane protein YdjX (TVP38/TMEM64 family)